MGPHFPPGFRIDFMPPYPLTHPPASVIIRHALKFFEPILVRFPPGARFDAGELWMHEGRKFFGCGEPQV